MSVSFFDPDYLLAAGPAGFSRAIERALPLLKFDDVANIDGPGDAGADIIAHRGSERWVWQCKWKKTAPAGPAGVAEVLAARRVYGAHRVAAVTNTTFSSATLKAAEKARQSGVPVELVDGRRLSRLGQDPDFPARPFPIELRPYQLEALRAVLRATAQRKRALLVLATGLGKTVIAGEAIASYLRDNPGGRVLVVAPTIDLVRQLENALWQHVPTRYPTHLIVGGHRPDRLDGVACATTQGALAYVRSGYRPGFILVDEAHHVGADGQLAEIVATCDDSVHLGVTATPWRGDEFDIQAVFGAAVYKLGIADGMRLGYLADVDYRLFVDTINWDAVRSTSEHSYTMKDLNSRLFLPQRDEKIRDELITAWEQTVQPRAITFCKTIDHSERMAALLSRVPQFRGALAVHADLPLRERQQRLLAFRSGAVPLITAVDVLNEGVDVPNVNLICFARVTHSRRIFVQQLGRGLRLKRSRQRVRVLDFVSDLRRVAAVMEIERGMQGDPEEVMLGGEHRISFTDARAENLMRAWIEDAASLETAADEARLEFPSVAV